MPLAGTLSTMPLPDLLQWLGTAKRTGTLRIERNKVVKWILFEEGRVTGCSSDDPPERLGHFLVSRGKITEEQLREALAIQATSKKHLGMTLVGMGALSEEDLTSHLAAKSEETIYSIFDWDDAVFRFEENVSDVKNVLPVNLQVEDMLLRGLKRFDEMRLIREVFDDSGIVLRQTPRMPPPELFHNRMARRIYESINGERTVGQILLIAHGSEYLVTKLLFELRRNGFVEIAHHPRSPGEPSTRGDEPLAAAIKAIASAGEPVAAAGPEPVAEPQNPTPVLSEPATPTVEAPTIAAPAVAPAAVATSAPLTEPAPAADPAAVPEAAAAPEAAPTPGPSPAPSIADLDTALTAARDLMARGEHDTALQLLDRIYQTHPQNESLRRLTSEAEAAFIDKAYRHHVPASMIPTLTRPVDSLETENLSPDEFYLLSRIDGTWDVKSIIQIAPLREADALRTLKRMREQGIIELREPGGDAPQE